LNTYESTRIKFDTRQNHVFLSLTIRVAMSTRRVSMSTRLANLIKKNVLLTRHKYIINGLIGHKQIINVSQIDWRVINEL